MKIDTKMTMTNFKKIITDLVVGGGDVTHDETIRDTIIALSNKYGIDLNIYSAYAQLRQTYVRSKITSAYVRQIGGSAFEINTAHSNKKCLERAERSMYSKISDYHTEYVINKTKKILGGN